MKTKDGDIKLFRDSDAAKIVIAMVCIVPLASLGIGTGVLYLLD